MDADAKRKKALAKLLQAASLDLDAARRLLTDPPNVLAANHLQQAAEKIISAVRLHRGLPISARAAVLRVAAAGPMR